MTITTAVFESHLRFLRDNGYTVIPLRTLVDWVRGKGPAPPPRSAVCVCRELTVGLDGAAIAVAVRQRRAAAQRSAAAQRPRLDFLHFVSTSMA